MVKNSRTDALPRGRVAAAGTPRQGLAASLVRPKSTNWLNASGARRFGAAAAQRAHRLRLATACGVRKHGPGVAKQFGRAVVGGACVLGWTVVHLGKAAVVLAGMALELAVLDRHGVRQAREQARLHAEAAAGQQRLERLQALARQQQAQQQAQQAQLRARQQAAAAAQARTTAQHSKQLASRPPHGHSPVATRPVYRTALHHEVAAFAVAATPTAAERSSRSAAVAALRAAVRVLWPSADLKLFGSSATGLGLPSSDLDVVVVGAPCGALPCRKTALAALKQLNRSLLLLRTVRLGARVLSARVPIIKCVTTLSGFDCDIGLGTASGVAAVPQVAALCTRYPMLRPLVLVLKAFLEQHDLATPFKGGIGGYALVNMVAAHLQQCEKRSRASGAADLGNALHDFLRFYGSTFDCQRDAVAVRCGGVVQRSALPSCGGSGNTAFALAIEDPQPPHKDIGAAAFNFRAVRHAFATAAAALDRQRHASAHGQPTAAALLTDAKVHAPVLSRVVNVGHALRR